MTCVISVQVQAAMPGRMPTTTAAAAGSGVDWKLEADMTMPIQSSMVTTLSSGTITSRKLVSWNTAMSAVHVKLRTRHPQRAPIFLYAGCPMNTAPGKGHPMSAPTMVARESTTRVSMTEYVSPPAVALSTVAKLLTKLRTARGSESGSAWMPKCIPAWMASSCSVGWMKLIGSSGVTGVGSCRPGNCVTTYPSTAPLMIAAKPPGTPNGKRTSAEKESMMNMNGTSEVSGRSKIWKTNCSVRKVMEVPASAEKRAGVGIALRTATLKGTRRSWKAPDMNAQKSPAPYATVGSFEVLYALLMIKVR